LGLFGFFGLCAAGWLADKIGRRVGFIALLIWDAVFRTLWVYAASNLWLWIFGLAWSFGFLGARARRSLPRSSRPAFAVSPTASGGSSASS
jgi:MFS family permease